MSRRACPQHQRSWPTILRRFRPARVIPTVKHHRCWRITSRWTRVGRGDCGMTKSSTHWQWARRSKSHRTHSTDCALTDNVPFRWEYFHVTNAPTILAQDRAYLHCNSDNWMVFAISRLASTMKNGAREGFPRRGACDPASSAVPIMISMRLGETSHQYISEEKNTHCRCQPHC